MVATGLTSPWGLVVASDGSVLVSERDTGLIRHVRDGEAREVITVADVTPANEGGLLGLVLSPDQRSLFAYHTTGRDNRITRYAWDGTRLSDPTVILSGIPYASNHDGGRMVFGPDGLLYVGTGDALRPQSAQDRSSLAGKILRITAAGDPAPGNPFNNAVFSLGHRNVQGLAFDDRGRLWASEFGDKSADELNLITRGGNYGWPQAEGPSDSEGLIDPVRTWDTDDASPSGLAFARGSLWMAGLRGERLWEIRLGAGSSTGTPQDHLVERYGRLRSVAVARDGGMLVSTSNTDGRGEVRDGDDRVLRVPLG